MKPTSHILNRVGWIQLRISVSALFAIVIFSATTTNAQVVPAWTANGQYRLLLKVDPISLGSRTSDERAAILPIDLSTTLQSQLGLSGVVDMNSIQVKRYNPTTGTTINDGGWAYGQTSADRAFRWYDNKISDPFPEMEANIHGSDGALIWTNRTRFGYFYDTEGDWKQGKLAFIHDQQGNEASYYAVYFNALPANTVPWKASPRGLLGDGGFRTEPVGHGTTGTIHTRLDVTDWDRDGLADIVAGNSRGGIAWYKNIGTATAPAYGTSKLLYTTDGKPIDVGWGSAPKVVDWDGDGTDDLLSGAERNRMVWYKNVGTNTARQFQYKGFITAQNQLPSSFQANFDSGPDGVVDVYQDPAAGDKVMIGPASGGRLQITTEDDSDLNDYTPDKAGRSLGGTLGVNDSFTAQYKFQWTDLNESSTAAWEFAGFMGDAAPQTRQMLGTVLRHWKGGSNYFVALDAAVGGDGYNYFGYKSGASASLGSAAESTNLTLNLNYDGSSHTLAAQLLLPNGSVAGGGNAQFSVDLDTDLPGLQGPAPIDQELNSIALTRLGWSDYSAGGGNRRTVWSVDSLSYTAQPSVAPIELPVTPNPEIPSITLDYYPVLEAVDFDNDGRRDLIAGGFITGRLYYYRNFGSNPDGTPKLELKGPILADGAPLDTTWGAGPTFADFNGDGLKDIVVGTFPLTPGGGDAASSERFLEYYVNVGTPTNPSYHKTPIPITGSTFPVANMGTPRAVDFNNDGLLDLIVSTNWQIYKFRNVGTSTAPMWEAHRNPLPSEWGAAPLGATQIFDWNGDGLVDRLQGYTVGVNTGQGNPGIFGYQYSILPPGQVINHLSGTGDDWYWQRMFDLDQNGSMDAFDADHDGKIWFHRNLGTNQNPNFDTTGIALRQVDGNVIDVGPVPTDDPFDILQGSRATYAVADFNRDGLGDLAVANFKGIVRYYNNESASGGGAQVFTLPNIVGDLGIRGVPFAADWDRDGWVDILASATPDRMMFIRNLGINASGNAMFAAGVWINLIEAPYGAGGPLLVTDFNGDGDADIVLETAYGYTTLIDGSFLQNGFAAAQLLAVQQNSVFGDYNADGVVNTADYLVWRKRLGTSAILPNDSTPGIVDQNDYNMWCANFGKTAGNGSGSSASAIPEPSSTILWFASIYVGLASRARMKRL